MSEGRAADLVDALADERRRLRSVDGRPRRSEDSVTALPTPSAEENSFALVADPAVVAVLVAALTILKAVLVSDHDKVRAALVSDDERKSFDNILLLLNSANVMDKSEVLEIAGGIALNGLQYVYRERPKWFIEGRQTDPVRPPIAPTSAGAN